MHCHGPPTLWTDLVVWEDAPPLLTSNSPFHHSHNVFQPILEHISVIILTVSMAHRDSCIMRSTNATEWMATDDVHLLHEINHFLTLKTSCYVCALNKESFLKDSHKLSTSETDLPCWNKITDASSLCCSTVHLKSCKAHYMNMYNTPSVIHSVSGDR